MLVFDQLKKNDPQLRVVAAAVLCGLLVLLAGLWWVQVVSARDYQANLETQSYRTVRVPAVRGKILDRDGTVLAENQPTYNLSLYLEGLRRPFDKAYFEGVTRAQADLRRQAADLEKQLHRKLTKEEKRRFVLGLKAKNLIRQQARCEVASNAVAQISERLQLAQPLPFNPTNFERHYETRLALPYPILTNLNATQIARLEEQSTTSMGVDLEVQSTRTYPLGTTAAHLLGYVKPNSDSKEGEDAFFSYRLPDFCGAVGIEAGYDKELRGTAGAKSVLVDNVGYHRTENIWSQAEPGKNVVLTIDARLQAAAEHALQAESGAATRGAAVVMDVNTGDVLAMVSSPTMNPNHAIQGYPPGERERLDDPKLRPQINRATQGMYAPGSIFKTIIGLAMLEAGMDPKQEYVVAANPNDPAHGVIYVGREKHPVKDTAPPGAFDLRRALKLSSNSYFIHAGIQIGIENIIRVGGRLHLSEKSDLNTWQDSRGAFPSLEHVRNGWYEGNTANLCIGQDPVLVTPLQMAVMTCALANGGKVLWPRLVDRIEPMDKTLGAQPEVFQSGRVRDELGVKPQSLAILREAMLADVEDSDGTGRAAATPGIRVCGKTGTAQLKNEHGTTVGHTTWFVSFAPYDKPRYAVVVMVERDKDVGAAGGANCAPVAGKIYAALLQREQMKRAGTLARGN
jgi:penicillin-binding protein 2